MVVDKLENLRIRVKGEVAEALTEFSNDRRISKQDIVEGLLTWFLDLEDLAQAMILGQVEPSEDLIQTVLRRNSVPPKRREKDR